VDDHTPPISHCSSGDHNSYYLATVSNLHVTKAVCFSYGNQFLSPCYGIYFKDPAKFPRVSYRMCQRCLGATSMRSTVDKKKVGERI
jgi:hypothetical protein